jgi:RHS repeat-associated protein
VNPTYDNNGNLTYDTVHNLTWDAEGNMLNVDSTTVQVTYDAFDRAVEQNRSGSYTEIVYAPYGGKLALMNGTTLVKAFVSLPGGPTAVYASGTTGPAFYRHADWLGSSRLASTQSRTKYFDVSYAPFGEDYNDSGTMDYNFTGQNQDTETGYYDFLFREYSPVQGRWISPDPAGTAAADPTNPQSWNRYAYVLNNPLALVDPLGLDCVYLTDDGGHVQEIDHEAINDGECAASGGYWIEGSVNDPSWVTIDSDAGTVSGYGVTWDGFFEFSVAGAMGTNPFGAWTQTFSLGETVNVIGTVDPVDTQASALAAAINRTGVQSIKNPCTVGAFYGASTLGVVATADTLGAGEIGEAGQAARTLAGNSNLGQIFGKAKWWLGLAGIYAVGEGYVQQGWNWTKNKAKSGCNSMQEW